MHHSIRRVRCGALTWARTEHSRHFPTWLLNPRSYTPPTAAFLVSTDYFYGNAADTHSWLGVCCRQNWTVRAGKGSDLKLQSCTRRQNYITKVRFCPGGLYTRTSASFSLAFNTFLAVPLLQCAGKMRYSVRLILDINISVFKIKSAHSGGSKSRNSPCNEVATVESGAGTMHIKYTTTATAAAYTSLIKDKSNNRMTTPTCTSTN